MQPEAFAGSLLSVMKSGWNTELAYSKAVISAVTLDPQLSQRIGVSAGLPWILLEQVNYNGDYPYAGGSKRLNRGETVEVKALPCNGWGLYQMHGNVYTIRMHIKLRC